MKGEGRSLADGASAHARGGAYIRARREGRGLKEISGVSGDPGDFVRKGRGCFSSGEEKRPPRLKISSLLGRLRTNNLSPTFKPGDGGRGICTLLPYVHNRIRLEKVPLL